MWKELFLYAFILIFSYRCTLLAIENKFLFVVINCITKNFYNFPRFVYKRKHIIRCVSQVPYRYNDISVGDILEP